MRTKQNLADVFPLTPLQQGILVHALDGGDDPYLLRACFRIEGTVDAAALHGAWQHVVDRHEALRADVEWTRGAQPVLRVFARCPVALAQRDWTGRDDVDARLRALVAEEVAQFSLQRAADLRVTLVRAAADRSYLVWVFHHLLLDGWSIANVLAEVLQAYQAALAGRTPELAPAPPYARYLDWLRARPLEAAEAYWRAALADHAPHEFPPRLPGGAGFAERAIVLDEPTSAALRALAADAKATLATCLHAAHALLIAAYTGHDDVVFGATVAGRPDEAGADAMVGAFINTVPVRVRIPQRGELVPWLAQLHAGAGARVAHEHLGLPRIQELAPARFESILVFESYPVSEVLGQAEALPIAVEQHRLFDEQDGVTAGRGRNNYPLTLVVLPGTRIELIVAYHRARLGDAVAAQLTARLAAIVHALAARAPLSVIRTAGAPAIAPRRHDRTPRLVHDRIAQWAQVTPDAAAVRCDDVALSYAALDASSDRLAARLEAAGVEPGDRVGLALPRGVDFVVAVLAVLKTGAAYVPLDREAPRARLVELIADAQLTAMIGGDVHPNTVALTGDAISPRRPALSPETPAYVIFTSGSTGAPKGVEVSHRALDHYATSLIARLGPAATTSMAMVSTVAADLGHTSLFGALCAGGTLHLISDERAGDPDAFCDYLARHQVASLKIVPGHLWGLMPPAAPERALPAHTLIIGGEAASPALLDVLRAQARCRVLNHYGPTETTVGVLTHPLGDDALALGHPLAHATAHVLGPDLRPLPAGAAGELYLGGASLAAGYFRRPALTAERFVPDPWTGGRLYRTGDRARRRLDGALEFLGRADDQVKIRGFRIELGEIRAELLRLPGVTDARVIARPAGDALQLHAYLIGDGADVTDALRARLPAPMIPSAFVWLARFPVTANGKLDVARLPLPAAAPAASAAPDTPVERALAEIWREVLRVAAVGRHDHFFHLGGDSILALKVVARARRAGYKLTPKQLFAHPTLAEAARVALPIEATASTPAPAAAIALTPIQHHFLSHSLRDPHHFNQAVLLELDAPLDVDQLRAALQQLARHHEALRLRLTRDGAGWRPQLADLVDDPVTVLDGAHLAEACSAAQRSLDLARGPLLRAVYFTPARLLLFAHHLVVDGVSWRILLEDLADLMRGAALPPPTTPFTAWTARLAGHSATAELAYWQRIVADLPAPRAAGTVGDAAAESAALDEASTAALLQRAPRAYGASVHALLLAALTRVLGPDAAITVEGHGREDLFDGVDLSRTVGWLATTYPVRLTAHADRRATVRGVVAHLAAIPAGGLGYGVLRHLAPGTPLAGAATPDVIFNYLGQFDDSFGQAFRVASESSGQRRSPHTPRDAAFVVNAVVYDGTLRIDWEHMHADREDAARLLAGFVAELRALIGEVS